MRTLALTVILALVCAPAFAGGGSKQNNTGTLHVQNNTYTTVTTTVDGVTTTTNVPTQAFILVDPSQQALANLQANPNTTTLAAAGGKLINANGSIDITKLKAGTHTVYAGSLDSAGLLTSNIASSQVTITKGQTTNLTLTTTAGTNGQEDTINIVNGTVATVSREMTFSLIAMAGLGLMGAAGMMIGKKG